MCRPWRTPIEPTEIAPWDSLVSSSMRSKEQRLEARDWAFRGHQEIWSIVASRRVFHWRLKSWNLSIIFGSLCAKRKSWISTYLLYLLFHVQQVPRISTALERTWERARLFRERERRRVCTQGSRVFTEFWSFMNRCWALLSWVLWKPA